MHTLQQGNLSLANEWRGAGGSVAVVQRGRKSFQASMLSLQSQVCVSLETTKNTNTCVGKEWLAQFVAAV